MTCYLRTPQGEVVGPLSREDLRRMATSGLIARDCLVQCDGSPEWRPASSVDGLSFPPLNAAGAVSPSGAASLASGVQPSSPQPAPHPQSQAPHDPGLGNFVNGLGARIGALVGTDHVRTEHVGGLFSRVLKRHDGQEVEEIFSAGLPSTTPALADVDAVHPAPWIYSRVLGFFGIAFLGLFIGWSEYRNLNLIPGLLLIGSFAFPVGVAIFFFECNVVRNISLHMMMKLFVWGGILGILLSLAGFEMTSELGSAIGPPIAGLVEELGKLGAVIVLCRAARFPWTLNGLVLGAAVGAGFSAFESAGYAFRFLLRESSDTMMAVIILRALLSPFAHVLWTAIAAGALWRVRAGRPFEFAMLFDKRCLVPLVSVMTLHAVWNSHLPEKMPLGLGYLTLGVVGWMIAIGLLLGGLREIRSAQHSAGVPGPG